MVSQLVTLACGMICGLTKHSLLSGAQNHGRGESPIVGFGTVGQAYPQRHELRQHSFGAAIRQPIDSHHDIHNAFDGITYSKGAGFLSMLEGLLGEENFQKAIGAFLRQNAEGIATVDDLLHALEAQGKQPISQVAKVS